MDRRFAGFPAGELRYISVPDLFFTGLAPLVDHLAEMKVILHLIWLRQRSGKQVVTLEELSTDETLLASLRVLGDDPMQQLQEGLRRAEQHGAVLHASVKSSHGLHEIYALNSAEGQRAMEQVRRGQLGVERVVVVERPAAPPRPNIFQLYEDNIGLISPLLADELREAEATYPAEWIEEAFRIAVENNVRKWRYIQAILEGWATRGRQDRTTTRGGDREKRWYTDEEFERFFKH
ncbi:MAG: DnaD domain protein [Anaerolineae bacterium]|nr:DnaD domain protein [Anaerolineae bacterium]MDW8069985.1 DnaD domain protein [Anaerolineae bacterium]